MPTIFFLVLFLCVVPRPGHCRPHVADSPTPKLGLRIELVHRDSPQSPLKHRNLTHTERFQRRIERSSARLSHFKNQIAQPEQASKSYVTSIMSGDGEFLMTMAIGTPSVSYVAILDTGSDLTWTQCKPCSQCFSQPTPIFDPARSSSYQKVPCSSTLCKALPEFSCEAATSDCEYSYMYGDYSSTMGVLGYEKFGLGSNSVPRLAFGCGEDNEGSGFSQGAGLAGFGRGALSLVSQMGASIGSKFSYCLTRVGSKSTSPLFLGGAVPATRGYVSTPLLHNANHPSFYYLGLEGISVGGSRVAMPRDAFALQSDGSGGLIIDSGTTVTYLEEVAYSAVRKAMVAALKAPLSQTSTLGLDTCFVASDSVSAPTVTLHFRGGADMVLEKENYLMKDSANVQCLAMLPSSGLSILGNVQQQNLHIVYDAKNEVLSFARVQCDGL